MKIKQITAYFCDHCNKQYQRPSACEKHEHKCTKNPKNFRACFGCLNCEAKVATVTDDYEYEAKVVFCEAKRVGVYPPQIEVGGVWHEVFTVDGEEFNNEPMPVECELKKEPVSLSI